MHYRIALDLALDLGTKGVYHLTLESQRKVQLQMPKNIFFCQKKKFTTSESITRRKLSSLECKYTFSYYVLVPIITFVLIGKAGAQVQFLSACNCFSFAIIRAATVKTTVKGSFASNFS